MSEKQSDPVNHPKYYNQYIGFEVIDICKQLRDPDGGGNYFRGNVFKYIARAGWKQVGDPTPRERILKELQDVKQAEFYIKQEIKRVQEKLAALDTKTVADDLYNEIFPAVDRTESEVPTVPQSKYPRTFACIHDDFKIAYDAFKPLELQDLRCEKCACVMYYEYAGEWMCDRTHPKVTLPNVVKDVLSAKKNTVVKDEKSQQKVVTTHYYCPDKDCKYAFTRGGIRENPEYCKNGHGSMRRTLNVG